MNEQINTTDNQQIKPKRTIRSFVLRQGRLTKGQEHALTHLWPIFGIDYQSGTNIEFNHSQPTVLEIGFGMGASLVEMAKAAPNKNFLGIEVHKPGVGACLMAIEDNQLSNLKVMCHDAVEVLENMIPDNSLDKVQIFFPDPWHKARHNKRRIIQPEFVNLISQKLKSGGILHLATDWQHYAEHMLEVLSNADAFTNLSPTNDYVPRPEDRPITKFEKRGQNLGHGVWDLQFIRK
ncbi:MULTISPECIES: tRNA (guanosine(46)-N7)-methyltransferase TrmB [unclassified Gilliamella]|uniref:tRNA (guanosine(46)-N7)-methyltransferase TrmB n=1 Tax=unclassified Gilliamella TaxID=2685620 RepID=UPI002269B7A9|nr:MULTISPECIES: tRNA (guanosine(46)-N7)-methyltransferase TrmB [unclassified Gilliamella]MCX8601235.1 tRNA (guanosine(46)-N7)-methyltransferase TrmB [Gilliamella sp. B3722]MCX8607389.1 tRNA (guanosine(46)-N7)-methyltransferase TrmB [Gilliamella sp. B3771]MCX8610422.1 tRNA (guanosine(46)-N7)-methyltransferase TrmB [Gilliamella sp. B3891]MCX8612909.1 tRNA (guanosine(46)-N7)-methyltransferase TrmB [Gilliamella sp. B3773]MCX8614818.1 tRNA (guanosine(46)-N7)-methyltransferase TrmB [Gilliamella sp.